MQTNSFTGRALTFSCLLIFCACTEQHQDVQSPTGNGHALSVANQDSFDAVDEEPQSIAATPGRKTLKQLVMEQRPAYLQDIEFNSGTIFSLDWTAVEFNIYSRPDSSSELRAGKEAGDSMVLKSGEVYCSFEPSGETTDCHDFMDSSDPRDLPISHSLQFVDVLKRPDDNVMWYRVLLGSVEGWTSTPYAYSNDGTYVNAYQNTIGTHSFVLWEPAEDDVDYLPGDSNANDVNLQHVEPVKLRSQMDSLGLQVSIDEQIMWVENEPFLRVYLSEPLSWEEYCMQTKEPVPTQFGFVPMFASDEGLALRQLDLGWGYCD